MRLAAPGACAAAACCSDRCASGGHLLMLVGLTMSMRVPSRLTTSASMPELTRVCSGCSSGGTGAAGGSASGGAAGGASAGGAGSVGGGLEAGSGGGGDDMGAERVGDSGGGSGGALDAPVSDGTSEAAGALETGPARTARMPDPENWSNAVAAAAGAPRAHASGQGALSGGVNGSSCSAAARTAPSRAAAPFAADWSARAGAPAAGPSASAFTVRGSSGGSSEVTGDMSTSHVGSAGGGGVAALIAASALLAPAPPSSFTSANGVRPLSCSGLSSILTASRGEGCTAALSGSASLGGVRGSSSMMAASGTEVRTAVSLPLALPFRCLSADAGAPPPPSAPRRRRRTAPSATSAASCGGRERLRREPGLAPRRSQSARRRAAPSWLLRWRLLLPTDTASGDAAARPVCSAASSARRVRPDSGARRSSGSGDELSGLSAKASAPRRAACVSAARAAAPSSGSAWSTASVCDEELLCAVDGGGPVAAGATTAAGDTGLASALSAVEAGRTISTPAEAFRSRRNLTRGTKPVAAGAPASGLCPASAARGLSGAAELLPLLRLRRAGAASGGPAAAPPAVACRGDAWGSPLRARSSAAARESRQLTT